MLSDLLEQGASVAPNRELVASLDARLTYAACLHRSRSLAGGLVARGIERAGCVVQDTGALVSLLSAASAVGTELCLFPATAEPEMVRSLASALGRQVVISDRESDSLGGVTQIDLKELADESVQPTRSGSAPLLILTTGTTGAPKAARYDWSLLIEAAREHHLAEDARWLLAYNLNQFAGIQVLVHVLVAAATLVVARSRQPADVLAVMTECGVTHASGTPTFWRLVTALLDEGTAARIPLRQITVGGEAVPSALLERLRRLFSDARISQVYASTEFGSAVSVTDGRSGLPQSVLHRGEESQVRFRIVDGELQALSRVGMLGYHGEGDEEPRWRPTGDLVEVRGDRIHFVGRSTDIINVGGAKVHPLPVEERVAAIEGVKLARVYGRTNPITGQIVAIDVAPAEDIDHHKLERQIRQACQDLPAAARPRLIRFVEALELQGDKLVRRPRTDVL